MIDQFSWLCSFPRIDTYFTSLRGISPWLHLFPPRDIGGGCTLLLSRVHFPACCIGRGVRNPHVSEEEYFLRVKAWSTRLPMNSQESASSAYQHSSQEMSRGEAEALKNV